MWGWVNYDKMFIFGVPFWRFSSCLSGQLLSGEGPNNPKVVYAKLDQSLEVLFYKNVWWLMKQEGLFQTHKSWEGILTTAQDT